MQSPLSAVKRAAKPHFDLNRLRLHSEHPTHFVVHDGQQLHKFLKPLAPRITKRIRGLKRVDDDAFPSPSAYTPQIPEAPEEFHADPETPDVGDYEEPAPEPEASREDVDVPHPSADIGAVNESPEVHHEEESHEPSLLEFHPSQMLHNAWSTIADSKLGKDVGSAVDTLGTDPTIYRPPAATKAATRPQAESGSGAAFPSAGFGVGAGHEDEEDLANVPKPRLKASLPVASARTAGAPRGGGAPQAAAPSADASTSAPGWLQGAQGALDEQANQLGQWGGEQGREIENYKAQRDAVDDKFEQQKADNLKLQQTTQQAIDKQQIDPKRYFQGVTGGFRHAMMALAQGLGALGAAYAHTPNFAQQIVQNTIDRDIAAQKSELGKKQNLLSTYMQQGHDLASAERMAKADLYDTLSASLNGLKARYGTAIDQQKLMTAKSMMDKTAADYRHEVAVRQAQLETLQVNARFAEPNARARLSSMGIANQSGSLQNRLTMENAPLDMAIRRNLATAQGVNVPAVPTPQVVELARRANAKIAAKRGYARGGVVEHHADPAAPDVGDLTPEEESALQQVNAYQQFQQHGITQPSGYISPQQLYMQAARQNAGMPAPPGTPQVGQPQQQPTQAQPSAPVGQGATQSYRFDPGFSGIPLDQRVVKFLDPNVGGKLVLLPDGTYGVASSPKEAAELKVEFGKIADFQQTVNELVEHHNKHGITVPYSQADQDGDALVAQAVSQLNDLKGLKRLTNEDVKIIQQEIAHPGMVHGSVFEAKMARLQSMINTRLGNAMRYQLNIPSSNGQYAAPRTAGQ